MERSNFKKEKAVLSSLLVLIFLQLILVLNIQTVTAGQVVATNGYVSGKVIVKYKQGVDNQNTDAKISQSTESASFSYTTIDVAENEDVVDVVTQLNNDPNVEYAEPIYIRKALGTVDANRAEQSVIQSVYNPNDPYYNEINQWGTYKINMTEAWKKVSLEDRQNVTIAIVDTGVDMDHPDLVDNIISGYDFINNDTVPDDDNGHGTHVAGIAAAIVDNYIGIAGVAGGVKIMPVKVLDADGAGSTQTIIDGIRYAVDNGADIINLSLGGANPSEIEEAAIQYALDQGVIVVAATGNESNHWLSGEQGNLPYLGEPVPETRYEMPVCYPAAYQGVIGVGAVDWYNPETGYIIADFSNVGDGVDVVAPGVDIYSTYFNGDYVHLSGTSMSTPYVAGLAALIKAANQDLSVEDIQRIIIDSAVNLDDSNLFGAGVIDGTRAVDLPRLSMYIDATDVEFDANTTDVAYVIGDSVDFDISVMDYQGILDSAWNGKAQLLLLDIDTTETQVVNVVYGIGTGSINFNDAGLYILLADDSESNEFIVSNIYGLIKRPASPVASVVAGTYSSSQQVTLSSTTQDSTIYYTLDETTPTEESTVYNGTITISEDKVLKAIALKNGVVSEVNTFEYIISSETSDGLSGGGGGGSSVPSESKTTESTITTDEYGQTTLIVLADEEQLMEEFKSEDSKVVVIQASTEEAVDKVQVQLTNELVEALNNSDKSLVIEAKAVSFEFQPGTLTLDKQSEEINLSCYGLANEESQKVVSKMPEGTVTISEVFDFNLDINETRVTKFNQPLTISIKFDPNKVKTANKLGVYYYNEEQGLWQFVGGKVNSNNTISFKTNHFSKYAVMELEKTFVDIDQHWAKNEIEAMASRMIINGKDENNFAPNDHITRAEFAAILVRALNIDSDGVTNSYTDVDESAWYNEAVNKALAANIIAGLDEEHFAPDAEITREQMATMIMRAYEYSSGTKLEDMVTTMEIRFNDEGAASSWARRNIILANATGLMFGQEEKLFVPKAKATRAEAVVIIRRLIEKVNII